MFEFIRATRKFGRAVRRRRAGDFEAYFFLLKEVYALAMTPSVNKCNPGVFGLVGVAFPSLVMEANRRGDSVLAKNVLDSAFEIWKMNERQAPDLRSNPAVKKWVTWMEAEFKRQSGMNLSSKIPGS